MHCSEGASEGPRRAEASVNLLGCPLPVKRLVTQAHATIAIIETPNDAHQAATSKARFSDEPQGTLLAPSLTDHLLLSERLLAHCHTPPRRVGGYVLSVRGMVRSQSPLARVRKRNARTRSHVRRVIRRLGREALAQHPDQRPSALLLVVALDDHRMTSRKVPRLTEIWLLNARFLRAVLGALGAPMEAFDRLGEVTLASALQIIPRPGRTGVESHRVRRLRSRRWG